MSTSSISNDFFGNFSTVRHLILNRMNYNWQDIVKVVRNFPNLDELKVCFNMIHKIEDLSENMRQNLKILDLECNPIIEWNYFKKLGELQK